MVLKCDFLHGAFLGSPGGFSPPAASKHCCGLGHGRQVAHGGPVGPRSGLTQEAPSPCLLKASAQGPGDASFPSCPGAPGGWACILDPHFLLEAGGKVAGGQLTLSLASAHAEGRGADRVWPFPPA